jgi:glycosyltransferase involved in cell wall biosynthesis
LVLNDCEDVDTLSEGLNNLVQESSKRQQMSKAARIIAEKHSWSSKARNYLDLFEELTARNSVAAGI